LRKRVKIYIFDGVKSLFPKGSSNLLVYLIFIVFFLVICRAPLFLFMVLFFSASIFSGILTNIPVDFFDVETNVNALVSCLVIFLLFVGFNSKPSVSLERAHEKYVNSSHITLLIVLACFAVLVNFFVFLNSFFHILTIGMAVGEFKNSGYGEDFVFNAVPPFVRSFSFVVSPLSYFCLAAHFYFLIISNRKMSALAFFGSLNIVLLPLIYFARGGLVVYVILYFSILIYVFKYLDSRAQKKIKHRVALGISPLIVIFFLISINRFEDYPFFRDGSLISNPVLYSIFDYLSQWMANGNSLLNSFDSTKIMYGSNFTYLPGKFLSPFGVDFPDVQELREHHFGGLANRFNGLPALLVYDFGYYFSFLFASLYMLIVRFFLARGRHILISLSWLSVLLPIPLFFFQGLFTVFGFFNLAVLYSVFISIFLRLRWSSSE